MVETLVTTVANRYLVVRRLPEADESGDGWEMYVCVLGKLGKLGKAACLRNKKARTAHQGQTRQQAPKALLLLTRRRQALMVNVFSIRHDPKEAAHAMTIRQHYSKMVVEAAQLLCLAQDHWHARLQSCEGDTHNHPLILDRTTLESGHAEFAREFQKVATALAAEVVNEEDEDRQQQVRESYLECKAYKPNFAHYKHPVSVWLRASRGHYEYTLRHAFALLEMFDQTFRTPNDGMAKKPPHKTLFVLQVLTKLGPPTAMPLTVEPRVVFDALNSIRKSPYIEPIATTTDCVTPVRLSDAPSTIVVEVPRGRKRRASDESLASSATTTGSRTVNAQDKRIKLIQAQLPPLVASRNPPHGCSCVALAFAPVAEPIYEYLLAEYHRVVMDCQGVGDIVETFMGRMDGIDLFRQYYKLKEDALLPVS